MCYLFASRGLGLAQNRRHLAKAEPVVEAQEHRAAIAVLQLIDRFIERGRNLRPSWAGDRVIGNHFNKFFYFVLLYHFLARRIGRFQQGRAM